MFVPQFSNDGRRLTLTGSGRVRGAEIIETNRSLLAQEERIRTLHEALVLLDRIDGLDAGAKDLIEVAGLDRTLAAWSKGLKIAVVATDPQAMELARMWEAFVAVYEWEVRRFRSRKAAEAWLAKGKTKRPGGGLPRGVRDSRGS